MIDATALRWFHLTLTAWLHQGEADALVCLPQENRTLRAQLGRRPLRLTDAQRVSALQDRSPSNSVRS